ncbi:DNA repair protein complementing XP-A cells homolog [Diadema antillarum]|uniref:DNA repair protein complementing XP-A cells homolog n=1 Tax=Diadema antillarum TaxID=105358 RepID=UPI003A8961EB
MDPEPSLFDASSCASSESPSNKSKLSAAQRAKVERNRQRALLLRQARLSARPYPEGKGDKSGASGRSEPVLRTGRVIDTGAGFLLEEGDETPQEVTVIQEPGPILGGAGLRCEECGRAFQDSYLFKHFDHPVCDECKDLDEKHELITKTDARNTYLMKDADFDKREPALKFITRKNPHNIRWGEMKLFLKSQVEKRALEVWGDEASLEEAREQRILNREKQKQKKYDKKVKELRRAVRTSMWTKDLSTHQHTYGAETYDEEEDMYSKKCTECGHVVSYEKM